MYRITSYIAVLLLLLFTRVMVPDALILELHPHTHTVHADHTDTHEAQIGQKHKHCPVEDLFAAPFHASVTSFTLAPAFQSTIYTNWHLLHPPTQNSAYFYRRGPPVA